MRAMAGARWRWVRTQPMRALSVVACLLLACPANPAAWAQGHPADAGPPGQLPGRYAIEVDLENARRACRLELHGNVLRERAGRIWYVAMMGEGARNDRNCEGLGFWEIEGWRPVDGGRQIWIMPGTAVSGEWRIIFIRDPNGEDAADQAVYRAPGGFNREGREPHDLLLRAEPESESEEGGE